MKTDNLSDYTQTKIKELMDKFNISNIDFFNPEIKAPLDANSLIVSREKRTPVSRSEHEQQEEINYIWDEKMSYEEYLEMIEQWNTPYKDERWKISKTTSGWGAINENDMMSLEFNVEPDFKRVYAGQAICELINLLFYHNSDGIKIDEEMDFYGYGKVTWYDAICDVDKIYKNLEQDNLYDILSKYKTRLQLQ